MQNMCNILFMNLMPYVNRFVTQYITYLSSLSTHDPIYSAWVYIEEFISQSVYQKISLKPTVNFLSVIIYEQNTAFPKLPTAREINTVPHPMKSLPRYFSLLSDHCQQCSSSRGKVIKN